MPDREKVIYDIERCICHVPDACRDCSHYKELGNAISCMEELLSDALALLKEQEAVVRCKDCKWNNGFTGCDKYLLPHGGDWFCADGERK